MKESNKLKKKREHLSILLFPGPSQLVANEEEGERAGEGEEEDPIQPNGAEGEELLQNVFEIKSF
jgi:hypothetical protein